MHLDTKTFIEIVIFILTILTMVWKFSTTVTTMKEQIKCLCKKADEKDLLDEAQDNAISKLNDKTSNVVTSLEVIKERSAHTDKTLSRVERKLDKLTDALTPTTKE